LGKVTTMSFTLSIKLLIGTFQKIVYQISWLKSGSFWLQLSIITKEKFIVLKI
jgi:hypothetical protein